MYIPTMTYIVHCSLNMKHSHRGLFRACTVTSMEQFGLETDLEGGLYV